MAKRKRKGDTGKNFEGEIRKGLQKSKDIWWFRIQDTNDITRTIKVKIRVSPKDYGKDGEMWADGYKGLVGKSPADFFSVYKGRPIMLEAKTSRNLTSFPLYYGSARAIPAHQVSYADTLVKHGGIGLIVIRREEYRNKKAWAILPHQAKYWYSKRWKRKSVKWSWIEKHGIPIERLKAPLRWNIEKLYERIIVWDAKLMKKRKR